MLDCNRNGFGYFPAAVFGIEHSKAPNCTPEVNAATAGHRMYVFSISIYTSAGGLLGHPGSAGAVLTRDLGAAMRAV